MILERLLLFLDITTAPTTTVWTVCSVKTLLKESFLCERLTQTDVFLINSSIYANDLGRERWQEVKIPLLFVCDLGREKTTVPAAHIDIFSVRVTHTHAHMTVGNVRQAQRSGAKYVARSVSSEAGVSWRLTPLLGRVTSEIILFVLNLNSIILLFRNCKY